MNRRQFLKTTGFGSAALICQPYSTLVSRLNAQNVSIPDIKIIGMKVHMVRSIPAEPLGYGAAATPDGITSLGGSIVELSTDAGITGWGEGRWGGEIVRNNPELILGRSPFEVEAIFDELTERETVAYHRMPRNTPSQGGLDTALWDLVGKAAGQPISKILGKRYHDRVMPYASAGYRKPSWNADILKGYADEIRHCVNERGFKAAKIKTGFGPTEDVQIVAAVREAIGNKIHLGIDSGTPGAYDDGTAIMLGRQLEAFNLEFWEEPINKWDLEGYQRLQNALRIPLASGEFLPVDWTIENYVNKQTVDIVQPDIIDCGLTGGRRIAHACAINRVRLVPHTWGGPIRNVASMHWVATTPPLSISRHAPPVLFELHLPEESAVWGLTTEPVLVDQSDGMIAVPTGPGLGIEINLDELERNRVELITI
ncbi:MAG: mandelate racemase/muconate lactonizing enzyme family protein [Verrucomicrobiae bacterium]|nr:mandelate racemase/muconate lactonizing enzyme family protein [Verrucomicrobiae bacterium]